MAGRRVVHELRRRLPEHFVFSVKAPRALTHAKRLYAPESWLTRIVRGFNRLGLRAGVLLVQLPRSAGFYAARLAYFLQCVPAATRVCMEFRHPSWHQDAKRGPLTPTPTDFAAARVDC